jgi:cystathionine beta-lyase
MKKTSSKTACVHSGGIFDPVTRGAVSPIYPSTSFAYLEMDRRSYPRYFNTPNQDALAEKVSALEHGEAGMIFSSGMAAISTTLLTFLKEGDHAVFQKGLYGGTSAFINSSFGDFGIGFSVTEGLDPAHFEARITDKTRLIYIETPSNPLMNITDIAAVVEIAKSRGILTAIDNTFASPINQNPLDLGVDIVIHSATKYLGGHSDICAGAVVTSAENIAKILGRAKGFGGSLNAQTCYLLERSIKTMALRVAQQNESAQRIAEFLNKHPKVDTVYYPGLPGHPGHDIARRQMHGFGGMLSFESEEGLDPEAFQKSLSLIRPSMSLGGVESIICSSALTSHAVLSKEQREAEGIRDGLLRLSVGIEETDDLIADLEQALKRR